MLVSCRVAGRDEATRLAHLESDQPFYDSISPARLFVDWRQCIPHGTFRSTLSVVAKTLLWCCHVEHLFGSVAETFLIKNSLEIILVLGLFSGLDFLPIYLTS